MAWRIAESVVRGEIDNQRKGCVTGRIWLAGSEAPLELKLQGNAMRDLAGCRLEFTNPSPKTGDASELAKEQIGIVGDMTASRKVRVLDVSVEKALAMGMLGQKASEHLANSVYLEWHSDANGRVMIESADFQMTISEPAWKMSASEEQDQCRANAEADQRWLARLTNLANAAERRREIDADKVPEYTTEYDAELDEFGWEKFLKESDARMDLHEQLLDKYKDMDRESRERLVAREMGWTHIEEYLDAKAAGDLKEDNSELNDLPDWPDPEPDPLTEGIDWIRTESGYIEHPLVHQAGEVAIGMWRECKERGLIGEDVPKPLSDMLFCAQTLSAKLAGALNGLSREFEPDAGFIVACLKRSLKYMNEALQHCEEVQALQLVEPERLARFKSDLYAVREGILKQMKKHRA